MTRAQVRVGRAVLGAATLAGLVTTFAAGAAAPAVVLAYVPPANPPANLAPVPDYTFQSGKYYFDNDLPVCWRTFSVAQPNSPRCVAAELAATNRAHALEHIPPAALPGNFVELSTPEQLLVITDIERTSRGEPPVVGLSATLDLFAQIGAAHNEDPVLPEPVHGVAGATGAFASNWAGGISSLDANYSWMYTDGWGGKLTFNYDCTSPHATGCWGHRDNILTNASRLPCPPGCALVMGAGFVKFGYSKQYNSYTELFVQVVGARPPLFYTWADAVAAGARP